MQNRKCVYLAEGECEEKLLKALKLKPSLLTPGKVKKFNVIQDEIPTSVLMTFEPGSTVVLVFDTDKDVTEHLKNNIALLKNRCSRVEVLTVVQVLAFEDEIERSTDVKKAKDFTKSESVDDFKEVVNRMKELEFRNALKRHKFDISKLWTMKPPKTFNFVKQDSQKVKNV